MNMSQYIQIIAVVIVFAIYIYGLFKVIKITRGSSPNKGNIVIGFTFATLLLIYLILSTYIIGPADFVQIMLMFGLVIVTTLYAISTAKQAEASVKMARRMVVPTLIPDFWLTGDFSADRYVQFEAWVHNDGNGPAYDVKGEIQDEGKPASVLATGDITSVLRGHDRKQWLHPDPRLYFPKSDRVQRRFFIIKYKDIGGVHEIRQPFVLTTVENDKPYARREPLSRRTLKKQNLEEELP